VTEDKMIWNKEAGDPRKGYIYYDCKTKIEYSLEELNDLPREIKQRICQRYKVIGCFVPN